MSGEKKVYFDNAATTPLRAEVKKAMIEALDTFGNPSSLAVPVRFLSKKHVKI